MELNIPESTGKLVEGIPVENLAQPLVRQPLIFRHLERPGTTQVFEFEDAEEDLDLFDDGEDHYYDDEIYRLIKCYAPTPMVSVKVTDDGSASDSEVTLTHYFDLSPYLVDNLDDVEEKMVAVDEDGTVKKQIIRAGSGVKIPEDSRVYYHYLAVVEGKADTYDLSTTRKYPKFTDLQNASNLVEGFEIALRSMEVQEVSRFIVHPSMAYGELGCPPYIPANVKIIYVVEVLHFIDAEKLSSPLYMRLDERSQLSFKVVYDVADNLRFAGNAWYKKGDYPLAIKKWMKGIQLLEEYPSSNASHAETDKKSEILLCMYSNSGQAYLKMEKPSQACNACAFGMQYAKADDFIKQQLLYRYAKAKLVLKDCDGALQLVEQGLKINKKDTDLRRLEKEIYLEDAHQRRAGRSVWSDIVNTPSKSTVSLSPQQGSAGEVKEIEVKMDEGEEKPSPKQSHAKSLKTLFTKNKSEKK